MTVPAREIFQRALILSAGDSKQKIAQSSQAARTNLKIDQNGNSNIFFENETSKKKREHEDLEINSNDFFGEIQKYFPDKLLFSCMTIFRFTP